MVLGGGGGGGGGEGEGESRACGNLSFSVNFFGFFFRREPSSSFVAVDNVGRGGGVASLAMGWRVDSSPFDVWDTGGGRGDGVHVVGGASRSSSSSSSSW